MNRPYIFCHMLTSLDGKIMGNYMSTPEGEIGSSVCADGSTKTPTLFMEKEGLSNNKPVHFKLEDVKIMEGDSLWLRYKIKK